MTTPSTKLLLLIGCVLPGCRLVNPPALEILKGRIDVEDQRDAVPCSVRVFEESSATDALAEVKVASGKAFEESVQWLIKPDDRRRHLTKYVVLFECDGYTPQLRWYDYENYQGLRVTVDVGSVRMRVFKPTSG